MAGFSDYLENELLDHVFGAAAFSAPAAIYVSLHTADPGETGANELPGTNGYARVSVTNNATNFPAATGGAKANGTEIAGFAASGGPWSAVTHFGLWDAVTAGNFLGGGALSASKTLTDGDTASFAVGDLDITLD